VQTPRGNITNEGPAIVQEASVQERHFNDYRMLVQTTGCKLEIFFLMAAHERAPERGGLYRVDVATQPDRFWDGLTPDGSRHGRQYFYRLQAGQRIATLEALAVLPQ
jgi:hypothetical protein